MKKLLASFFAFAMILTSCFAFVGCEDKTMAGTYRFDEVFAMGLNGTREDIASYRDSIESMDDVNKFAYVFDIVLAMDLKINKDKTGEIRIANFMVVSEGEIDVNELGLTLEGADLVLKLEYEKISSKKIKLFPINNEGNRVEGGIGAIIAPGDEMAISDDFIATYSNGKLTLSFNFGRYNENTIELPEAERTVVFETLIELVFKKK